MVSPNSPVGRCVCRANSFKMATSEIKFDEDLME